MLFPQLTCVVYFDNTNTYGSLFGFIVGLFFRLAGGDSLLKLRPLIKYPWYIDADNTQLFPYKTFSMLITFVAIFIASFITNALFKNEILPKRADIFKCVVNISEKSPKKTFHPMMEVDVDMSSRNTITTYAGSSANFEKGLQPPSYQESKNNSPRETKL